MVTLILTTDNKVFKKGEDWHLNMNTDNEYYSALSIENNITSMLSTIKNRDKYDLRYFQIEAFSTINGNTKVKELYNVDNVYICFAIRNDEIKLLCTKPKTAKELIAVRYNKYGAQVPLLMIRNNNVINAINFK